MWASQLLTLNTSTSSASITFDFTNPTDRIGPVGYYAGVSVIEVVMFNCPARGIVTMCKYQLMIIHLVILLSLNLVII